MDIAHDETSSGDKRVGRHDAQEHDASRQRDTSPRPEAFGDNLPANYYRSARFLGSVAVS